MKADIKIIKDPVHYGKAHKMQLDAVEQRKNGLIPDTLFLLEHYPVITLGKSAAESGVVASADFLKNKGIDIYRIERGGEATYHAPGQLVGYPIMDLHKLKIGVAKFVYNLEEIMIRTSADLGVKAVRINGKTGVFAKSADKVIKIGALGVRVTSGITFHGFALNINIDLSGYDLIVPCGLTDIPVGSINSITCTNPEMSRVHELVTTHFLNIFY